MILTINRELERKLRDYTAKTETMNPKVAAANILDAVLSLDEEERVYIQAACLRRYDKLNAIDVEDGDFETDAAITGKMRQLLYLSFLFKEDDK